MKKFLFAICMLASIICLTLGVSCSKTENGRMRMVSRANMMSMATQLRSTPICSARKWSLRAARSKTACSRFVTSTAIKYLPKKAHGKAQAVRAAEAKATEAKATEAKAAAHRVVTAKVAARRSRNPMKNISPTL